MPELKDEEGNWNTKGHPQRIVHVTGKEMHTIADIFSPDKDARRTPLPAIHASPLLEVLELFGKQPKKIGNLENQVFFSDIWNETNSQKDGTIQAKSGFPASIMNCIYTGPNMGLANCYVHSTRKNSQSNSDYDRLDLTCLPADFLPRTKYQRACSEAEYARRAPSTPWKENVLDTYRIVHRKMVNSALERTLICAIAPKGLAHINGILSLTGQNPMDMTCFAGFEFGVPYDFFIKVMGKKNVTPGVLSFLPVFNGEDHLPIVCRALLLNCLTTYYSELWQDCWREAYASDRWAKSDPRLSDDHFKRLTSQWTWDTPLRSDYARREALVELDVLTAMALGMTLDQLKTIYRIQFSVLQSYEKDTWYDARGRIVHTNNRSMTGIGFSGK